MGPSDIFLTSAPASGRNKPGSAAAPEHQGLPRRPGPGLQSAEGTSARLMSRSEPSAHFIIKIPENRTRKGSAATDSVGWCATLEHMCLRASSHSSAESEGDLGRLSRFGFDSDSDTRLQQVGDESVAELGGQPAIFRRVGRRQKLT